MRDRVVTTLLACLTLGAIVWNVWIVKSRVEDGTMRVPLARAGHHAGRAPAELEAQR